MDKYGLALDNLTSVELVIADGCILYVSEEESADLFWAVRGVGNFHEFVSRPYLIICSCMLTRSALY
jgi:hypothetical protein